MVDEKEDTDDATETKKASDKPAKPATAKKAAKIENPSLPKDRNARVREQAARKLAEAKGQRPSGRPAAGALSTEELVDDALARGFAAVLKWAKVNVRYIEGGVALLVLIGIGYMAYDWRFNRNLEKASDSLAKAMRDANGRISPDDQSKPNNPDEPVDPRPKFPTVEARREAALSGYRLASTQYSGTGAAILARLGEAGTLLDRKDYDGAAAAFRDVIATQLANADIDVKLSATEGLGMALEGKGDVQGALDAYKKLEGSKEKGYAELGMYHQARLLLTKKNERELAKTLLQHAKEGLSPPVGESATPSAPKHEWLLGQINALLREIDPTLAPAPAAAPGQYDPAQIEQLLQQQKILEQLRKAQQQQQHVPNPGSPAPLPTSAPSK